MHNITRTVVPALHWQVRDLASNRRMQHSSNQVSFHTQTHVILGKGSCLKRQGALQSTTADWASHIWPHVLLAVSTKKPLRSITVNPIGATQSRTWGWLWQGPGAPYNQQLCWFQKGKGTSAKCIRSHVKQALIDWTLAQPPCNSADCVAQVHADGVLARTL